MDLNKNFLKALNTVYNNKGLCLEFSDELIETFDNSQSH